MPGAAGCTAQVSRVGGRLKEGIAAAPAGQGVRLVPPPRPTEGSDVQKKVVVVSYNSTSWSGALDYLWVVGPEVVAVAFQEHHIRGVAALARAQQQAAAAGWHASFEGRCLPLAPPPTCGTTQGE